MGRADLHIHTRLSDGAGSVDQILEAATDNLDVIAITDHNEIDAAFEAASKVDRYHLEVVIGEEISSTAGHIIGLYLKKKIPSGLEPREVVAAIHEQGGLVVIPHPFVPRPFPTYQGIGKDWVDELMSVRPEAARPDAVEVANGFTNRVPNAEKLVREENQKNWCLPEVGGSDSHHPGSVGSCWTVFKGYSSADLRVAIRLGETVAAGWGWSWPELFRASLKDALYFQPRKKLFGSEDWQYTRPKKGKR